MISVQEKLNIFRQELDQKLEDEKKEALKNANQLAAEEINKSDIYILEQKGEIESRYQLLEERNVKKLLAQAKAMRKDDILKLRKQIAENFFDVVADEMGEIRKSELYDEYLKASLKAAKSLLKEDKAIVLYVLKDERDRFEKLTGEIFKDVKIVFKDLPKNQIGGFYVRDKNERINYDFSLYNVLEENRSQIELALERALNSAEDE